MSDSTPLITVYKSEDMPMAHPKPMKATHTAWIRRLCRYEYGDDLGVDDKRPEPERGEVTWGYLSNEYQATLLAQQQGAHVREDSGIAGFKVSGCAVQKPNNNNNNNNNSSMYGVNGANPYAQQHQDSSAYANKTAATAPSNHFITFSWSKHG